MLQQILPFLAAEVVAVGLALLETLAMAAMAALTGAQVVVAAQGLMPLVTLAQAATEQTALLL
jgi:hypothetical protein